LALEDADDDWWSISPTVLAESTAYHPHFPGRDRTSLATGRRLAPGLRVGGGSGSLRWRSQIVIHAMPMRDKYRRFLGL
jgi:hypothetical protein